MSILEKLKSLVEKIESENPNEKSGVTEEAAALLAEIGEDGVKPLSPPETEPSEQKDADPLPGDYLECTREETDEAMTLLARHRALKAQLAELVISFDNKKKLVISEIRNSEQMFYENLNSLRIGLGLPEEGYSVELPDNPGDLVVFVKD